jgi:mRNA interferase MazF
MTGASYDETNPFAVKFIGPKGVASYILSHQPRSFESSYLRACESLNQIIEIGSWRR